VGEGVGSHNGIGVHERKYFASGVLDPEIAPSREAQVAAWTHNPDPILPRETLHRSVGTPVVNENHFSLDAPRIKHGLDAVFEPGFRPVGEDRDTDSDGIGHGGSLEEGMAYTAVRSCEIKGLWIGDA
jgi:hypothetical protein